MFFEKGTMRPSLALAPRTPRAIGCSGGRLRHSRRRRFDDLVLLLLLGPLLLLLLMLLILMVLLLLLLWLLLLGLGDDGSRCGHSPDSCGA